MDYPDLVNAADLEGLPGSPFTDVVARAGGARVRSLCGWHVAPEVTETIVVDGGGSRFLRLPSLHVTGVSSVQVWTRGGFVDATGWDSQTGWSEDGFLFWDRCFQDGFRTVRVTLTHGFSPVPDDLKLLVAANTGRRVMAEAIASRTITFGDSDMYGISGILEKYKLGARP